MPARIRKAECDGLAPSIVLRLGRQRGLRCEAGSAVPPDALGKRIASSFKVTQEPLDRVIGQRLERIGRNRPRFEVSLLPERRQVMKRSRFSDEQIIIDNWVVTARDRISPMKNQPKNEKTDGGEN